MSLCDEGFEFGMECGCHLFRVFRAFRGFFQAIRICHRKDGDTEFTEPEIRVASTQNATMAVPLASSGTPMTAASVTSGWATRRLSTSAGPTRFARDL